MLTLTRRFELSAHQLDATNALDDDLADHGAHSTSPARSPHAAVDRPLTGNGLIDPR